MENISNISIENSNSQIDPNLLQQLSQFEEQIKVLQIQLIEQKEDLEESKKDFLTILGLFVSLITFVSVEIQILKAATSPLLLIGLSCIMVGGLLLFAMTLINFVKDANKWPNFKTPLFIIPIMAFVMGCGCFFWWAYCDRNIIYMENKFCLAFSGVKK